MFLLPVLMLPPYIRVRPKLVLSATDSCIWVVRTGDVTCLVDPTVQDEEWSTMIHVQHAIQ